jgi:hypothetical protein
MGHKNTAAFGIYPNRVSVEEAIDALKAAGFRDADISALFPENSGTKDFGILATRSTPKPPKERQPGRQPALSSEGRWDGC